MEKLRLCSVFSLWGAGARDSNSQKVEMCGMGGSGVCEREERVGPPHLGERSARQSDSASSDLLT
jgi:hypothetical protein